MGEQQAETVDEYIDSFSGDVRDVLTWLRATVTAAAPDAIESISYHMPTLTLGDRALVFYAAWKTHVALYAIPGFGDAELEEAVAPYRSAKDTLKFSLRKPVPYELIGRVVTELVALRAIA